MSKMFGRLQILRGLCSGPQVFVYQNLFASKPSVRNRPKIDNFKSYEDLRKMKQYVFREHSEEKGLGPIPRVDECAKMGEYKNPEYYSYHHYTYYDFKVGNQCMHLPQPSALDEKDLVTMVRKTCSGDVEDHSGRSCPPPRCAVDCLKELDEKDVVNEIANVFGTCDQTAEVGQYITDKAPDEEDFQNEGQDKEDQGSRQMDKGEISDKFGCNLDGKPE